MPPDRAAVRLSSLAPVARTTGPHLACSAIQEGGELGGRGGWQHGVLAVERGITVPPMLLATADEVTVAARAHVG
jgi:hypothetical protein